MFDPTGPLPDVSMETGLLDPALFYVANGYEIIPLDPFTNIPCAEVLGSGYKMSEIGISDPDRVREIWVPGTRSMMRGIGVPTGQPNKLLVLDGDIKHGGQPLQRLYDWQQEAGFELARGAVDRTPSGGWHYHLFLPAETGEVPSPVGWLPDVDVRADGAQVPVPPSVVQKYPTSSRSFSDPKDTRSTKKQPLFFQYEWIDTAGQLRFPTGLELRTATRRAVAPDGLLEDIRSNRGRRGREANLRTPAGALKAGATGGHSKVPVQHYLQYGVQRDQWYGFYEVVWSVISKYPVTITGENAPWTDVELIARDEARKVIYRVRDKSPVNDPGNPWTNDDLDLMVDRALLRKRKDGDATDRAKRAEKAAEDLKSLGISVETVRNLSKGNVK